MIIFGMRARHKVIGEGQFFCPHCQARRNYLRKKATRYFALYFVPIIPLGEIGEYIECQTCRTTYQTAVLETKPPATRSGAGSTSLAQMLNSLRERLDGGTPAEFLVRDLTTAGLDRAIAQEMVNGHLDAAGRKSCETCGLTYAASVRECTSCHQPLA